MRHHLPRGATRRPGRSRRSSTRDDLRSTRRAALRALERHGGQSVDLDPALLLELAQHAVQMQPGMLRALERRGYAAEDVVQEVMVKLLRAMQSGRGYDPRRAGPKGFVELATRSVMRNLLDLVPQPGVATTADFVDRRMDTAPKHPWTRPAGVRALSRRQHARRKARRKRVLSEADEG